MLVTKIQRFSTHDGPGIRTVVFLSGCPLNCWWCHNPEARLFYRALLFSPSLCIGCGACEQVCPQNAHSFSEDGHRLNREKCVRCLRCTEICPAGALTPSASDMTVDEIMKTVRRDRTFYEDPDETGGMTLSGGEPLAIPENALSLLRAAKTEGISTAVETSGFFDGSMLPELVPLTDRFLWDFKDGDDARYRENIGVSPEVCRNNLIRAGELGARITLRCIMVAGVNMDATHRDAIAEIFRSAHCEEAELLPYHPYGESKYSLLEIPARASRDYIPTPEALTDFRNSLTALGVSVKPLKL